MAIDVAHYEGREPTFVKHTFLDKYLPSLIAKVGNSYPEFVFVDGFAGPWKSQAGSGYEDTSFGIALNHMTSLKVHFAQRGRQVRMIAILVEKAAAAHSELAKLQELFPRIEITTFQGLVENHVAEVCGLIPSAAFAFFLFDPKGFPNPRLLSPLLARPNSEALVNFMFDFANRFATTDLIPALGEWLEITGIANWQQLIAHLPSAEREIALNNMAREALRTIGGYRFAPSVSVDRVEQNRTLYKLIYLSRSEDGLAVFRDGERKALEAQAASRSRVKAARRDSRRPIGDLFAKGDDAVANDRSSRAIQDGERSAQGALLQFLGDAGDKGCRWRDVWPRVLADHVVTKSALGRMVNELRKNKTLCAPNWPSERHRLPPDDQRLILSSSA